MIMLNLAKNSNKYTQTDVVFVSVKISRKQLSRVVFFLSTGDEKARQIKIKSRKMLIRMGKKGCRRFINSSVELSKTQIFLQKRRYLASY